MIIVILPTTESMQKEQVITSELQLESLSRALLDGVCQVPQWRWVIFWESAPAPLAIQGTFQPQ